MEHTAVSETDPFTGSIASSSRSARRSQPHASHLVSLSIIEHQGSFP